MYNYAEIENLIGKTLVSVEQDGEVIRMQDAEGIIHEFEHVQDCCERVYIESIVGELSDLVGSPIITAEKRTKEDPDEGECGMWTFYAFATLKGYVDIRWYGSSNGYYGVGVGYYTRDSKH